MKIAPLALIGMFVSSPTACFAQWIDFIQTESDWEDLYDEGYFDYGSYQLYRELAEGDSPEDRSQYLESALGNSVPEIYSSSQDDFVGFPPVPNADEKPRAASGRIRTGHKVLVNDNSGYYLVNMSLAETQFGYKGRNDNNDWTTERRSLRYSGGDWDITLGNYTAEWGLGLAIGRFDYRPQISDGESTSDLLFPDNSYYNGLKIDYRDNRHLYYSVKKYGQALKNFWGGSLSQRLLDFNLGISLGATLLTNGPYRKALGSGSFYGANDSLGIRAELAYGESGLGFLLKVKQMGFDIRVWLYDDSYINLQSSGYAYPDYISYEVESAGLAFRQVQAGEGGLLVEKGIALGRIDFRGIFETWKRARDGAVAGDYSISARYRPLNNAFFYARFSELQSPDADRRLLEFGPGLRWFASLTILSSFYIEDGFLNRQRSFSQIYCGAPIGNATWFNGRLRFRYNGRREYFLEERAAIFHNTVLIATYRWRDTFKPGMGPLYVILERVF